MVYVHAGTSMKFALRSVAAGALVKAICRSETVGTGMIPSSFGEKEKTGYTVKCIKTRMRKKKNIASDP
jgi:hypothetical protein